MCGKVVDSGSVLCVMVCFLCVTEGVNVKGGTGKHRKRRELLLHVVQYGMGKFVLSREFKL